MISDNQKPSFTFEGHRSYIFIKECHDKDGGIHYHFFIFDEVGACHELRYFCHPVYLRQIENTLLAEDGHGNPRTVWELEPHPVSGYPPPLYEPIFQQVQLRDDEKHLCLDRLYAMELIRHFSLKEAADASSDNAA